MSEWIQRFLAATPRQRLGSVLALGLLSGLLLGFSIPGHRVPGLWLVCFVPLYAALDLVCRTAGSTGGRWLQAVGVSWCCGMGMALVSGGWISNTSELFGHLPLLVAWAIRVLGFGSHMALEIFLILVPPFLLAWRRPRWLFVLCLLWSFVVTVHLPRPLFYWTFGQLMYSQGALVQIADLGGSALLNIPLLGLQLILYGFWRGHAFTGEVSLDDRLYATLIWSSVFAQVALYGHWRLAEPLVEAQPRVRLIGVQPNFSLKHLSSNPQRTPGDRRASLEHLLADSTAVLERDAGSALPTVVLWPESTYPHAPYRERQQARQRVHAWAAAHGVQVILTSIDRSSGVGNEGRDGEENDSRASLFGAAFHIDPRGGDLAGAATSSTTNDATGAATGETGGAIRESVYHKRTLIPFGEQIPFVETWPALGAWIQRQLPYATHFTAGEETVGFAVAEGVVLAPLICFDIARPRVARDFKAAGANLGVVLANLAWFGETSASRQFEQYARFRAIETRMPFLMLSQNGRSLYFDARGEVASEVLPSFADGTLRIDAAPARVGSFYVRYGGWVEGGATLLLFGLLFWGYRARLRRGALVPPKEEE